jgi:hypothetical protein
MGSNRWVSLASPQHHIKLMDQCNLGKLRTLNHLVPELNYKNMSEMAKQFF